MSTPKKDLNLINNLKEKEEDIVAAARNYSKSLANVTTEELNEMSVEERKKAYRYMRDRDRQLVKGIFRFHEVPTGTMSFVFKQYEGDPVEKYELIDGEVSTIPLGVAKHLNKNAWYPINANSVDGNGKPSKIIGRKIKRCSFQSLDFTGLEDLGETLIEEVTLTDIPRAR